MAKHLVLLSFRICDSGGNLDFGEEDDDFSYMKGRLIGYQELTGQFTLFVDAMRRLRVGNESGKNQRKFWISGPDTFAELIAGEKFERQFHALLAAVGYESETARKEILADFRPKLVAQLEHFGERILTKTAESCQMSFDISTQHEIFLALGGAWSSPVTS